MNKEKFLPPHPLNTAVLFLVFNRLDTAKRVFEEISKAKPPRLYIASDGSRDEKEDEKVQEVRKYLLSRIDWDCEVKTLFRDKNLGCKLAVSGAISWFFQNEEMGIVLEDDCLPSQSFFWYCEELLLRYKDAEDVYMISGDNISDISIQEDYTFIKYALIWGWASWARVWKKYDVDIENWHTKKSEILSNIGQNADAKRYWKSIFEKMYRKEIDTWDYQLTYLLLKDNAKCAVPQKNLISNIGFGEDATHTLDVDDKKANIKRSEVCFPIKYTDFTKMNDRLNEYYETNEFSKSSIFVRVINKLKRMYNEM